MTDPVSVAILGASGYTGAELIRLLSRHPRVRLAALTANRKAGQTVAEAFPHLRTLDLPPLTAVEAVDWSAIDFVICALPHATTQTILRALLEGPQGDRLRIADLSADFRLKDPEVYARWYGHAHQAVALQQEAVYGLVEVNRAAIAGARLVAVAGCYPTCAQLPLVPLVRAGLIEAEGIIIDAKSGVSGAGREAKEGTLHCEVSEGIHAYAIGAHRHGPEIEQGLSEAAGHPVMVTFTPHLVPMNRGILSTIYARLKGAREVGDIHAHLSRVYADEPFVTVVPEGVAPHTRHVRGSNHVLIGVHPDRVPGRVILTAVEDNLVKGASGQAIQAMNVMMGFPETLGLDQMPLFP